MNTAPEFDLFSPDFHANPYPYYAMLQEKAPIFFHETVGGWCLTRYEDVLATLKDARFGRDIFTVMTREEMGWPETPEHLRPLDEMRKAWILDKNPPQHTHLRTLVHKAFTPRIIEHLRERAQTIAEELIDNVQANGSMDIIADFALPLPTAMIAGMLGVPEEDHARLNAWSSALLYAVDLTQQPELMKRGAEAATEFMAYLRELITKRRKNPQEDLISALLAAGAEHDKLTEDEMVSICTFLLFAGYETTVNLIGNGMLALLRHPDQWEKLKADPSLIKSAVEELVRYDSPLQLNSRFVLEDMEFAGHSFKRGQFIMDWFGAANRDPARFVNPNELDITRDPNPHIAVGSGSHFCLGAPLARMEGQIAFATLARRLPHMKLVSDEVRYRPMHVFRGLEALPVTF